MRSIARRRVLTGAAVAVVLSLATAGAAHQPASAASGSGTLFVSSALEHPDDTVTLPLHRGVTEDGRDVYYVVFDASTSAASSAYGVNRSNKLANAANTMAVQKVTAYNGVIRFEATVDFAPVRQVAPGPQGFPPSVAEPGSVGEDGYSPLIQLPDGTVLNAPHVANATGLHDKAVAVDFANRRVRLKETHGFQGGRAVKYVSTDSSSDVAAALEGATHAPRLAHAPRAGDDSTDSSRASLAAFVNGQTGASNPNRQGLDSALLDGLDPLNVLFWNPTQGRYSPLWDVFPTAWAPAAMSAAENARQTDFGQIKNLAQEGLVTGPDGARWGAADIVVNCPIVSRE